LSPTAAHIHDPVCVPVNVTVLDETALCAPVKVVSAPVNTRTLSAFAVKLPVRVLDTVMFVSADGVYAHHDVSELAADPVAVCSWSIFVHVNPPPLMANVLLSSARQNATSSDPAGGENAAVVAGFAVPVTNAGVLESSATDTVDLPAS
jgi:hypothetical protein